MVVKLDREDLLSLLTGTRPGISFTSSPKYSGLGWYSCKTSWRWRMPGLSHLTDEELFEIYQSCKVTTW